MPHLPLSLFKGWKSDAIQVGQHTWPDLCTLLTIPSVRSPQGKASLTYFALATFAHNKRNSASLETVHAITLDCDDGLSLTTAQERLELSGLNYLIITSWSHQRPKNGKPPCDRYRIIIPLAEPLADLSHYNNYYDYLSNKLVDNSADKSARGPERLHGWLVDGATDAQHSSYFRTDGKFFNPANVEFVKNDYSEHNSTFKSLPPAATSTRLAVCSMLDTIDPNCDYSQWIRVAWSLASNGFAANDLAFHADVFDVWSSSASNYDGSALKKFKQFRPDRENKVSIRTLRRIASDNGWHPLLINGDKSLLANKMKVLGWEVRDAQIHPK